MTKPLKESPQKDGLETKYDCGLHITGGWGTRLAKYKDFINSPMGKYIIELEHANNKAEDWISVFGDLPEVGQRMLCFDESCERQISATLTRFTSNITGLQIWQDDSGYLLHDITHYKPLSNPPKQSLK